MVTMVKNKQVSIASFFIEASLLATKIIIIFRFMTREEPLERRDRAN
jgi:hypothetical protein